MNCQTTEHRALEWDHDNKVEFDTTMLFGLGYDFEGLEVRRQEADTPIGRFVVWPDYLGKDAKWNLYGGCDGWYQGQLASADDAKSRVALIVARAAPSLQQTTSEQADG